MSTARVFHAGAVIHRAPIGTGDLIAACLVLGAIALGGLELAAMAAPAPGAKTSIDLSPWLLPGYVAATVARMLIALALSIGFAIFYARAAARSPQAERVLLPLLDILQSVPILGYLAISATAFSYLAPSIAFGAELASILALFTSQAWNLAFSYYQSLKTQPADLVEVARSCALTPRQRWLRLELPLALPGLVWNAIMSVAGGWFFIVAAEAIDIGGRTVVVPGIGAYIATALEAKRIDAILWAIAAMALAVLTLDLVLFRPLLAWSSRFQLSDETRVRSSRVGAIAARAPFVGRMIAGLESRFLAVAPAHRRRSPPSKPTGHALARVTASVLAFAGAAAVVTLLAALPPGEVLLALWSGLFTCLRVAVMTLLAAAIWTPLGILIGIAPVWTRRVQPVAQFLAAFPANLLYPAFVLVILKWRLDPDIWLTPLIVLGTQWYILFNVIAGAAALPSELRLAARSLGLRGWPWWRRLALPAVFPYLTTGLVTAAGGAWNASVVAEAVSWGGVDVSAHGLGSYIAAATRAGDAPRLALGVGVMALFVVGLNRLLWRPLYALAERRYRMD